MTAALSRLCLDTMIIDDIHKALDVGRVKHAQELFMARCAISSTSIPKRGLA